MRGGGDTGVAQDGRVQGHNPVHSQIRYCCLQISINFAERFGKLNVASCNLFSPSNHIAQLLRLNLSIVSCRILVQFSYHQIAADLLLVSEDVVKDTAYALHLWLPSLGGIRADALAYGDVGLDPEREGLLVDVLTSQALPVERAGHGVDLLFELGVVALHDLNPGAGLRLVGHCLPLEALGLEEGFKFRINLKLARMLIVCVVVEAQADDGAVHVLPNVIQRLVHEAWETLIVNES